jgi:putative FmdB family regulatory protein
MPIYEYRCADCGHELEAIQKFSDSALERCPACGTDGLRRKISAAAFRLKGGGWYETDFKKDNRRNVAADADAGAGAKDKPAVDKPSGDKPAVESGAAGVAASGSASAESKRPATGDVASSAGRTA